MTSEARNMLLMNEEIERLKRQTEALIAVVSGFGCHSDGCLPGFPCSCGLVAALQAAGLVEAEVWK